MAPTAIPQHEAITRPRKGKKPSQPAQPVEPAVTTLDMPDVRHGLAGVEEGMEGLSRLAGLANTYMGMLNRGEVGVELFTSKNSYPVRLELEGEHIERIGHALDCSHDCLSEMAEAAERIATAFERIATALEGKVA